MIIVDTELKKRAAEGRPIRVGMAGAGFMGRGIVNQLAHYLPGMRLAGIFSRNTDQ
jgi:predicted homoserine dehydrogenase-like protein